MKQAKPPFHIPPHWQYALLAMMVVLFYPSVGFAAVAGSTGDIFCNVLRNSSGFPPLFSGLSYIAGGVIIVRGLFDIAKRAQDPNNKQFKDGILGLMAGGMLAALPSTIDLLHNTIFRKSINGAGINCTVGRVRGGGGPVPLDEMLNNFVNNIMPAIIPLISGMAVILGIVMIFYNMIKLSKFGSDAKTNTLTPIIGSLIIGALLVAIGETMNSSLNTLFGTATISHYSSLAYTPGGSFDMTKFNNAMGAVFKFLYIVGSLSFVRGFFIMKNALEGSGQATKGQAYTHIIGGTLLVNMPAFIKVIGNTVGFNIINT